MQIHQLKPRNKNRIKRRIGRGGKLGTYSGKGIKGQKARSGRISHPIIRDLIKRFPKLRGYRFNRVFKNLAVVNIGDLDKKFQESEVVNPQTLIEKKLIRRIKGRTPKVKILGKGELTKKLIIEGCEMSEAVRSKLNVK